MSIDITTSKEFLRLPGVPGERRKRLQLAQASIHNTIRSIPFVVDYAAVVERSLETPAPAPGVAATQNVLAKTVTTDPESTQPTIAPDLDMATIYNDIENARVQKTN
jgi:hypothetical protein